MKVNVYLSYYNGSRYIDEQINSLLNQKGCDVHIFIRDDGSKEHESLYLDKFKCCSHITIFHEKNVGFGKSFMSLVVKVKEPADFYAFCDQDDVWLDNKLEIACEKISSISGPAAYCCLPQYVNDKLEPLVGFGTMTDKIHCGFMSPDDALEFQLFGIGCTFVWNNALNDVLQCIDFENFSFAHDNFFSVFTPFVGSFIRDDKKLILYRQHGGNVSGNKKISKGFVKKIRHKIKNFNGQLNFDMRKFILDSASTVILTDKLNLLKMSVDYRKSCLVKLKFMTHLLFDKTPYKKKIKNLMMIFANRY